MKNDELESSLSTHSLSQSSYQNENPTAHKSVTNSWLDEATRRLDDLNTGRAVGIPQDEFKTWFKAL
jgi:hypothetical protein